MTWNFWQPAILTNTHTQIRAHARFLMRLPRCIALIGSEIQFNVTQVYNKQTQRDVAPSSERMKNTILTLICFHYFFFSSKWKRRMYRISYATCNQLWNCTNFDINFMQQFPYNEFKCHIHKVLFCEMHFEHENNWQRK